MMNPTKAIKSLVCVLSIMAASSSLMSCIESDEQLESTSTDREALTAFGTMSIGGTVFPIDAVRVSGSTKALTALPLVDQQVLEIDTDSFPATAAGDWMISLPGGTYDLGNAQVLDGGPTLAAAKTSQARLTVKFSPEYTRFKKGSGKVRSL